MFLESLLTPRPIYFCYELSKYLFKRSRLFILLRQKLMAETGLVFTKLHTKYLNEVIICARVGYFKSEHDFVS